MEHKIQKKVAFKTLGCRLNQYETDSLASDFHAKGYKIVPFSSEADIYVVNTCTVTNQSDHKSRNIVRQARRKNNAALVVLTGCMANSAKDDIKKLDIADYVIENAQKSSITSIIDAHFEGELVDPDLYSKNLFDFRIADQGFHTRSMIKIQDGCNNFCTFCIIPKVRGREASRPADDILTNIKQVLEHGSKEIVLTGVNISRYNYEQTNFEDLIEKILQIEGDFRVRISSMEPDGLSEKFFDLFNHPKLTPHLHLCLQSGSERVLKLMRRMYKLSDYYAITEKLKNRVPDFNFSTDIIVGFPGETDKDFENSIKTIDEIGFSHVHTFKYSVRKGTLAEKLPDHIDEKIKNERSELIRELSEQKKLAYRQQFLGKNQRVLIEKITKNHAQGYGEHFVPVRINKPGLVKNCFIDVKTKELIMDNEPVLIGE